MNHILLYIASGVTITISTRIIVPIRRIIETMRVSKWGTTTSSIITHPSPSMMSSGVWNFIASTIADQISVCGIKFLLEPKDLLLEHWNGPNTTIHWIFDPCFGFIGQRVHSILSLMGLHLIEEFAHVACTKYLVNICKFMWLFWWEIWGKNAIRHALPSQKLAGCTWRIGVARRGHDLRTLPPTLYTNQLPNNYLITNSMYIVLNF